MSCSRTPSPTIDVFNLIMQYNFRREDIEDLDRKIKYHTHLYSAVPDYPLVPKLHCLSHVPNDIVMFGPPRRYWFIYSSHT